MSREKYRRALNCAKGAPSLFYVYRGDKALARDDGLALKEGSSRVRHFGFFKSTRDELRGIGAGECRRALSRQLDRRFLARPDAEKRLAVLGSLLARQCATFSFGEKARRDGARSGNLAIERDNVDSDARIGREGGKGASRVVRE